MTEAGLYIHIPFCKKRCNYCDFFSCTDRDLLNDFVDELCNEITLCGSRFPALITTVYFGGGTPSLLSPEQVEKIFNTICNVYPMQVEESTIEVNPSSDSYLSDYKKIGINRVSIGVQTLNDDLLKSIGRLHTAKKALSTLDKARNIFDNVSADLILGLNKSQDIVDDVTKIQPFVTHLSGYMLSVPQRSVIKKMIKDKLFFPTSDDETADQYDVLTDTCRQFGLYRYETSNYSRLGKEGIHNSNYWEMKPYIGVGPSAHSYYNGRRYYNKNDLKEYLLGHHSGNGLEKVERKHSTEMEIMETIMLSLRTVKGLNISEFDKKFSVDFMRDYADKLDSVKKYVKIKNGRLSILPQYFSVQNSIIISLLSD